MKKRASGGTTLIELLVAMTITSIIGTMILQMVIDFQSRILSEISRNDLQDRAERLLRFLANDIRDAAFLLGPVPLVAGGTSLVLTHDSLSGDPLEVLPFSILSDDDSDDDDRLTIVKAISFAPPLRLAQPGLSGESAVLLNRRPNLSPGSTRELLPAPEAINHLVFASHRVCYAVHLDDLSLQLQQPLIEDIPADTEILGVRAYLFWLDPAAGSNRLRRDDFTSRDIFDDAVDGLQFEYLMEDGSLVDLPTRPQDVRGVRISLLVRDLRADQGYTDENVYMLGNRNYGPFRDHYRRSLVTQLVEVKNHGLQ
ncbi:MAG: PilW family protein [Desulfuromonadales bacterium]|nr:PilW family protein [Desulfuromonadales bacterium]